MRVLLTGSSGFLGRHFDDALAAFGAEVVHVDLRQRSSRRPPVDCRDFFRDHVHFRPDLVIHCAAVVEGRETIDGEPLRLATENLSIDAAMFNWARQAKPGRVLYLSSSAVYPWQVQTMPKYLQPIHEDALDLDAPIGAPETTYGWTKLVGERMCRELRACGVPVTVVRPFSGYGTDQAPSYPFPAFIGRAAAREDPFVVWGDGTQVRDFIHVDDLVSACLRACAYEMDGPVNLGWGEPVSLGELAMLVCESAGYVPTIECQSDKPTGVAWRVADATQMLSFYAPKVSLEEGIARALHA